MRSTYSLLLLPSYSYTYSFTYSNRASQILVDASQILVDASQILVDASQILVDASQIPLKYINMEKISTI